MARNVTDDTVLKGLGYCSFGNGSNTSAVDVKDGRIARIRPLHYDTVYSKEDLNYWTITARGKTFEPGMKSFISPLSLSYKMRAYSPNRILYPLKRVDWDPKGERNPQTRGTSPYERISWDEATTIIAAEIDRIHREYGPKAILCQCDGHGETKAVHGPHGCVTHLLKKLGGFSQQARNADSWEGWYWGAKHVWGMDPMGQQAIQSNIIKDISEHGDAILFWGADPETTPWGWGGQMASRLSYWFNDLGIMSIYIAPDVNYGNAVHADMWIPVFPNTDAALQLAIIYVWMTEGTYDSDYIDTHAIGFDWLEYYVLGREDGEPKTPEWAAEKCGVPSYRIKALARYWAKHKVSIAHCNGGGYIRSCFSHEPARLEVYLLSMQGMGNPGRHQFKMIEWSLFGIEGFNPMPPSKKLLNTAGAYRGGYGGDVQESFIPKTLIPQALRGEEISWYGHTECSLPRVDQFLRFEHPHKDATVLHMVWSDSPCWTTCWNGGNSFQDAIRSENIETFLVQHPWFENDCHFADIILPISTKFELEDFATDCFSGQWSIATYERPAIEHVGESLSDMEAVGEVAKKLEQLGGRYENMYDRYMDGKDVAGWIRNGFDCCGITDEIDFDTFKEQQFAMIPTKEGWEDAPVGLSEFLNDPEGHPLGTPTGKIEIYATGIAENFPDDTVRGPVAHWIERTEEHDERRGGERAKSYPFLMMSNHPRWRVHANDDDIPWLREIPTCKIKGPDGYLYEPIWVNPRDAERLGLAQGDIAKIYNERGGVLGAINVTERVMEGVLYQDHGARADPIIAGVGGLDRGGANNLICPTATTSPNCAGEVTNSFLVNIEKVDVEELAKRYPEAFGRAYDAACGSVLAARMVKEGE